MGVLIQNAYTKSNIAIICTIKAVLLLSLTKQSNPKKSINYFVDAAHCDYYIYKNVNFDPSFNL